MGRWRDVLKWFYPFPFLTLYKKDKYLTELFETFADAETFRYSDDGHWATVYTEYGELIFWISNRWYAWAASGTYINTKGERYDWSNRMPHRYAMKLMRNRIGDRVIDRRIKIL